MRLQNLYTILKKRIKKIIFINSKYYKRFNNTEKKIILLDTPLHGNLGDHAICQAEKRIITNYYKEMCYFEFSHYDWIDFKNEILKVVAPFDSLNITVDSNFFLKCPFALSQVSTSIHITT